MSTDKSNEPAALRLSNTETQQIGKYAAIGTVLAGLYGLGHVYFSQTSDTTPLRPETESAHHIPDLRSLLVELQDHRNVNDARFCKIVNLADRFCRIYNLVVNEGQVVTSKVQGSAHDLYKLCGAQIKKFGQEAYNNPRIKAEAVSKINEIQGFMFQCLQDAYLCVVRRRT